MEYRKLGKLDWKPSALGFGCMRLPTEEGSALSPNIIEKEAVSMLQDAIDKGVNYIDTAYLYHSGKSENIVGKALKDGYRDKVKLATKSPLMIIKKAEDYNTILDDQLKKLDVDFIDFYLFHAVNKNTWELMKNEDLIVQAEKAQKAGKIGHICFSFHDKYEVFEDIINGYDKWDMCQIQYNLMDSEIQAGEKGLKLAASKGIGVVIMEPLKGGQLANPIPEVKDLLDNTGYNEGFANLSLQWLWNQPEVSVVLSGMTNKKQLEENIISASKSGINTLSKKDLELASKIKDIYAAREGIPCTGCSYCMPCPQSIDIPRMLGCYNDAIVYSFPEESKRIYNLFGQPAKNCVQCKKCEEKCPQSINISELMPKIDDLLAL